MGPHVTVKQRRSVESLATDLTRKQRTLTRRPPVDRGRRRRIGDVADADVPAPQVGHFGSGGHVTQSHTIGAPVRADHQRHGAAVVLLAASRLAGRGDRLAGHGLPAVGTGSSARGATCAAGRTQHSRHQRQRQVQWTICKRVNIFIFLKEKFEFCQIGNDYANLFKFDPANCNVINRLSK